MSAYNWITVEANCPVCRKHSKLRCQTHIASDYGGDQNNRFHDRDYRLGEAMQWRPKEHKKFPKWRVNGRISGPNEGEIDWECCYASCSVCGADLYVVIRFDGPRSASVEDVGLEENWPRDYKA